MRNIACLATAIAVVCLASVSALAQGPDFSKVEEEVTELGHNMYALRGAGGNTTVAVGTDGIIVVDAQFAPLYDKIKAKLTSISPLPVRYLVNTHYHVDHTGGNESFAKDGATIVAHENSAKRMADPPPDANGNPRTPASKGALPTRTYSGRRTDVKVVGQTAKLLHLENGHTDGDTIVFWPAANVISTGDFVTNGSYPNIDVTTGGGVNGMIAGTDFIIAHSDANTKIVPGHGPVTDKKGVIAYRKMMLTARARIAKAKAEGMSEDQVVEAHLLTDLDKDWLGKPNEHPVAMLFPRNVYRSVK